MKFFKKRSVALILCLLVIVGSTLWNTDRKLGGDCRDLSESFYAGDGIAPLLETLHVEAGSLAAVAEAYCINTDALRGASEDLQGMLSQRSTGCALLYSSYDRLRTELRSIEQQLLTAPLSEDDAAAVSKSLERVHSAQASIGSSSYNSQVRSFLSDNRSLLTRVLARLAGVAMPEEFA